MELNNKTVILFISLLILIIPISAYERYMPGSTVYVNETIDVSSVNGWADYLAYYGGWGQGEVADYLLKLPPNGHRGAFFLDPAIFGNRTGYWYQWYGNGYNDNKGFTLAFRVVNGERNITKRYDNGSINFETEYKIGSHTEQIIPPPVSVKHVADYLVARGDNLTIKTDGVARVWIFGNKDGLYNLRTYNSSVFIDKKSIQDLRLGDYKVLVQYPGNDMEFNVIYNKDRQVLSSLYSKIDNWTTQEYDVSGYAPMVLYDKVLSEIDKTNDGYKGYTLVVEDPGLDIIVQDEIDVSNVKVLQVKGYTNTAVGTQLCFGIDENIKFKSLSYTATCVKAQGTDSINQQGDMRYFVASIPFSYNDLSVGHHQIVGNTSLGGTMSTSFDVYTTFDDKPKNTTLKYIAGNLFVPTPTPEVIKVVETQIVKQVVTQIVEVQLTPNLQELYDTQKKVDEDNRSQYIVYGAGLVCLIVIIYILSVLVRGMRREE